MISTLLVALALQPAAINIDSSRAILKSSSMERTISLSANGVATTSFSVAGRQMLASRAREFSFTLSREASNQRPRGLRPDEIDEKNDFMAGNSKRWRGDEYDPGRYDDRRPDAPRWVDHRAIVVSALRHQPQTFVVRPAPGVHRLTVRTAVDDVAIDLHYELFDGYPVIRKWASLHNHGTRWLKLDRMTIDDVQLVPLTRKPLAAALFGVQPSVVAFETPGSTHGLIAASEVPSALRTITDQGAMGYAQSLFEWVLGPGEEFATEPVFYFGYNGAVTPTASSVSTPLDRALEGPYMNFVRKHIGIAADSAPIHGPQWMTWAYFYDKIDDPLIRQLASIAGRAGFTEMLLDDGWQKGRLGTEVDTKKFPDFAATAEFIRAQGMAVGLWVSCFRDTDSRDMAAMPDARILPTLIRGPQLPGLAMSFASNWRDFYVQDLLDIAKRYGVSYFKQDFTNIMYGDLAEGHESRTRRESLLRGLRGLLATQAELRRRNPALVTELTHEIWWGTPGVPADLAALKHAPRFHIPPNEAIGADLPRFFPNRTPNVEEHQALLRQGCWLARQRFYSHRGLPLYPLEFYAAATSSYEGSLSSSIQDRQIASWLMGVPVCFSGDSRTLNDAQIAHYRKRLDAVKRLEKTYGIYKRFQFSGVPEPTDVDWHWWGKLNTQGHGAVVVVRGSAGSAFRMVNIPWVRADAVYRVSGVFSGKQYGTQTGAALRSGLRVDLPVYGQELLELAPLR